MSNSRRIVCYAINGSGMGHLTRLISVGRWLRRFVTLLDERPPEILFLTSSDASDVLARAGFASFKIPSKTVAGRAELNKLEYRRLAKQFVWHLLGLFSPDLLVVDTFPAGSFDELFQVLDGPFKKGFIFRGVKSPYAARPTFRSAMGLYDAVVVPHRQETAYPEQLAPELQARFSGEVIQFDRPELIPAEVARRELGVADGDQLLYVSAGGGGDANAELLIRSLVTTLQHRERTHLLVGAGPLYRGSRLSGRRLTWFDAPQIWRYFGACDAAVCAAGYNTFHELIYTGVPTLFYAQEKIADDQSRRINEARRRGACLEIADPTDAKLLLDQLHVLLDPTHSAAIRSACQQMISTNGARQCALELLRPLYEAPRLQWASQVLTPGLVHALEQIADGSSSTIPDWLVPLMPNGQIDTIASHPGFAVVLSRLSREAAQEVQQALAMRDEAQHQSAFEASLSSLCQAIGQSRPDGEAAARERTGFPDEVLKTVLTIMKRQPCEATANGSRTGWVCTILQGIERLLTLDDLPFSLPDRLRLFRMFPKLVDGDVSQAFQLFERFLRHRTSQGEATHETMHQLQVLKLARPRMTCETLESQLEEAMR